MISHKIYFQSHRQLSFWLLLNIYKRQKKGMAFKFNFFSFLILVLKSPLHLSQISSPKMKTFPGNFNIKQSWIWWKQISTILNNLIWKNVWLLLSNKLKKVSHIIFWHGSAREITTILCLDKGNYNCKSLRMLLYRVPFWQSFLMHILKLYSPEHSQQLALHIETWV